MKSVSIKYLFRNKKNNTFFTLLFFLVVLTFLLGLFSNYYSYKLIEIPSKNLNILVYVDESEKLKLEETQFVLKRCKTIEEEYSCQMSIDIQRIDSTTKLLDKNNIKYIVYDNVQDLIYKIKIRNMLFICSGISIVCVFVIMGLLINNMLSKEEPVKNILNYLGSNKKKLMRFNLNILNIILLLYNLLLWVLAFLVILLTNNVGYLKNNILFFISLIILINLVLYIMYIILLRKNINKIKRSIK